jgi:hypothetical protein
MAYDAGLTAGVYVAAEDVDGDGVADIVTGVGSGGAPQVNTFSGRDGTMLHSLFAYPAGFMGGVRVGAADLTGDGHADVITGAGPGGGPHVRVFDARTLQPVTDVLAYDPAFQGGVFVGGR